MLSNTIQIINTLTGSVTNMFVRDAWKFFALGRESTGFSAITAGGHYLPYDCNTSLRCAISRLAGRFFLSKILPPCRAFIYSAQASFHDMAYANDCLRHHMGGKTPFHCKAEKETEVALLWHGFMKWKRRL